MEVLSVVPSTEFALPGATVTWTATVRNNGPDTAGSRVAPVASLRWTTRDIVSAWPGANCGEVVAGYACDVLVNAGDVLAVTTTDTLVGSSPTQVQRTFTAGVDEGSTDPPANSAATGSISVGPVLGKTVAAKRVNGTVLIKVKGKFVPLTSATAVRVGSTLDTRRGTVELRSAVDKAGATQSGRFGGGMFTVKQSGSGKGLTELPLTGGSFKGCKASRTGRVSAAAKRRIRSLRGNAKGKFRTRGRYSSATVRGTEWTVIDRCDGTLTRVTRGAVTVRDFRRGKNVIVRAGRSYLVPAKR